MISSAFDPEILQAYVAVCRHGSFSKAASQAGRAQSALSTQIRRLESLLGKPLLRRTGRGVQPTADGEVFLNYAARILALGEEAAARMGERTEGHPIKIGLAEDIAVATLHAALGQIRRLLPGVHLDVVVDHSAALAALWRDGLLDIAIGSCSSFTGEPVDAWEVTLRWVCGIDLDLDPTRPLDVIVYAEPCQWRRLLIDTLASAGRDFRIVMTSQNIGAISAGVENGLGVALLTPECIRPGTMQIIRPAEGTSSRLSVRYGLYSVDKPGKALTAVLGLLRRSIVPLVSDSVS